MEQATDLKPKISVILPALMGYDSVRAALDAWEAQTSRGMMEIIVLCPTVPSHSLPPGQIALETGSLHLHQARAAGVRRASADYVLLAEDHCLPDPDCVESIVSRLDEQWDAVGPALRPGDRGTVAEGSFLISYAQWMLPKAGSASSLPGHNAVLRKQRLLEVGEELEDELIAAQFLMRRIHSDGGRFFVDDRARMRHFDAPTWGKSIEIFFSVGMGFGAVRLKDSSKLARLLYMIVTPATAARHFARGVIHYVRAGRRAGFGARSLVAGGVFACVWAWGEAVGAWLGVERVIPSLWIGEIKPVSREKAASTT